MKKSQAQAEKQTELTHSQMEIQIAANRGDADLAQARKNAEQTVVMAEADNRRRVLMAEKLGFDPLRGPAADSEISPSAEATQTPAASS